MKKVILLKEKMLYCHLLKMAMEVSKDFKQYLKAPHDLEYEKHFSRSYYFPRKDVQK
jgi:hypothetical protein